MKLPRWVTSATEDPEPALEAPVPPPTAPRGAARATYAGVLDGRHLWLAIALAPGRLAVRDRGHEAAQPVPLPTDLLDDQPEHRSVRTDLDDLGLTSDAGHDLVLVAPAGRVQRIWSPPLPPRRMPVSPGADAGWEVRRDDDGWLSLHRVAVPPHVELAAVEVLDDGVRLVVHPPAPLVLRAQEGDAEVARLDDGLLRVEDVDGVSAQVTRVTTTDGRPVLRRDDDLLNPGRGAPLPDVYLPGSSVREPVGVERLRLRWTDRGLSVHVLDEQDGAA